MIIQANVYRAFGVVMVAIGMYVSFSYASINFDNSASPCGKERIHSFFSIILTRCWVGAFCQ